MIETLGSLMSRAGHELIPPAVPWALQARASLENPATPLSSYFNIDPTYTGVAVTAMSAQQCTAVWACKRILAGSVAKLPLITYRRTEEGRERARDHYLHRLLQQQANPDMTAFRFRHLMQSWITDHGNAYAAIEISGRGQVVALYPMKPSRVIMRIGRNGIRYDYVNDHGDGISLPAGLVLHLRWMSDDGYVGRSPIEVHRQTIGLALAQTEASARFFGNGMKISGVLTHPAKLGVPAMTNLRKHFEQANGGLSNAWKMLILEEGMKYEPTQSTMQEADFIAQMKFGNSDFSRIYGVPLHMLAELDRSTNNNIEHQGLEFVNQTIDEHLTNWESEIAFSLLSDRERQTIFVEHLLDKLLRGDTASRYAAYGIGADKGFLKIDEIRERENLNRVPGGDIVRTQMQMVPLGYIPPAPKGALTDGKA